MSDAAVVSIKGVTKTFAKGNVTALQDIDLDDRSRGEFVSLIGPSGCGKSTLLRDDRRPDRSRRRARSTVNGKPAHQARLDHDYGIVFQDAVLFDWRTVAKNVALPLEMLGWDRAKREGSASRRCSTWSSSTGFERPPSVAALGRHADARRDRARARRSSRRCC